LTFFWGAFALVRAATGQTPWFLLPAVAMITYGWMFHAGFFNYYLGIGLSFWGLAIVQAAEGRRKILALPVALLTYMAHPLALVWFAGAAGYMGLAAWLPRRRHVFLLLGAAAVLFGIDAYIRYHFEVEKEPYPFGLMNGADQLVLADRYYFPAAAA